METTIEIMQLGPADVSVLDHVAEDVFDNAIDPVRARDFLNTQNHVMFVARADGADGVVVGIASGVVMQHPDKPPQLFVNEVGVGPAWQRRGIATRLVEALLNYGRHQGCNEAWLGTELDNIAARGLYQALAPREEEEFVLYTFELD